MKKNNMLIKEIKIFKSKTVGYLDQSGKTRFKKVQFEAGAELGTEDDPHKSYDELSDYVVDCLAKEVKK